jgi:hypothetical protein
MPSDKNSATDESTGLPRIRRWNTVYLIVLALCVAWVGLLTWLTLFYA